MEFHEHSGYAILIIGILLLLFGIIGYQNANDEVKEYETDGGQLKRALSEYEQDQYEDAYSRRADCLLLSIFSICMIVGGIYMINHLKGQKNTFPPGLQPPPIFYTSPVPPGMMICPYCQAVIQIGFTYCPNCRRPF